MATLQKIRNKAGLLIAIIIGVAIFAFVLQDLMSSGKSVFTRSRFEFAEIDGKSVVYNDFQSRVDKLAEYYRLRTGQTSLDEATMESIREQTWQDLVREYATKDEYKELGIAVSTDELMDMIQGRNPHPIIRSIFADPQTGTLNRSFLVQFIRTMDEDPTGAQKTIWLYLENEIIKDRAFSKYNNLISKGLYVTNLEAEDNFSETDKKVDFSFVVKRFNSISDTAISYSGSDVMAYYKENQNLYRQEASVDLEYVVFEVTPTEEDDRAAQDWIFKMKNDFETEEDVVALVNLESDLPFDDKNYKDGELSDMINDFMFSAQIGDVIGPYFENESYRFARLLAINYLPDSVRARHILIQPDADVTYTRAREIADSLKNLLDNGFDFATLAMNFSADGSAQDGGDLGWFTEGMMVKPFNDSCFYGEIGEIQIVETQFGVHIVEVLEKGKPIKKVKVAILARNVEPSSKTYQQIYSEAVEFAGLNNTYEKFNAAIAEQNLTKRYAEEVRESQRNITGLDSPRELIRWAFSAEKNQVSDVFEFGNKFVVAAITEVREDGIAPLDMVRAEVELEVKKNKKAEKIIEEFRSHISSATTLDDLANSMNLTVQEATGISFSSVSIPAAGIEPNVIATALTLAAETLSEPVKANNGVYVLVVNSIHQTENADPLLEKNRIMMLRESQANYETYNALRKASKIKDNRSKFF